MHIHVSCFLFRNCSLLTPYYNSVGLHFLCISCLTLAVRLLFRVSTVNAFSCAPLKKALYRSKLYMDKEEERQLFDILSAFALVKKLQGVDKIMETPHKKMGISLLVLFSFDELLLPLASLITLQYNTYNMRYCT